MCIVIYALDSHPKYRLILATNRDEFIARPTSAATFRDSSLNPTKQEEWKVLSGRDEVAGGLWFGLDEKGELGVLTNFTEPIISPPPASTRGSLLLDFLSPPPSTSTSSPSPSPPPTPFSYLTALSHNSSKYAGFNLLLISLFPPSKSSSNSEAWYLSNRTTKGATGPSRLASKEIGGMSNSVMLDPWEKVSSCKTALEGLLEKESAVEGGWKEERWLDELEGMMSVSQPPTPTLQFPLSLTPTIPPFVLPSSDPTHPRWYGTRLLSMLLVTHEGEFVFVERDVWVLDPEDATRQPVRGKRENERKFEGKLDVE